MNIDDQIQREIAEQEVESKQKLESELKEIIIAGDDYSKLQGNPGWQRLKEQIAERSNSLSGRLLTTDTEKALFRLQGEILGLQSILNIVEMAIENSEEAKKELEGEENG